MMRGSGRLRLSWNALSSRGGTFRNDQLTEGVCGYAAALCFLVTSSAKRDKIVRISPQRKIYDQRNDVMHFQILGFINTFAQTHPAQVVVPPHCCFTDTLPLCGRSELGYFGFLFFRFRLFRAVNPFCVNPSAGCTRFQHCYHPIIKARR